MLTDPLGDLFSRLRNGAKARREFVEVPYSKMKERILQVLKSEGYLTDVELGDKSGKKTLTAHLKFQRSGDAVLENIRRKSKPGHRVYSEAPKQALIRGGVGCQILSTSKGIMTDKEAVQSKIGGEVLGEVW